MTGNFYCVSSSCARVVYREYLPPSIRWRYPGEDWNEIIGADNYTLQQDWYGGQDPTKNYRYKYGSAAIANGTFAGWSIGYANRPSGIVFPIQNVRMLISGVDYGNYEHWAFNWGGSGNPPPNGSRSRQYQVQVFDATNQWKIWINVSGRGHKVYGFELSDGSEENPGGGNCTFSVYKDGQIVHQETRPQCPEVEQLPCRLSDISKEIKISKLPYLERVEVVDYGYTGFGLNTVSYPLPDECLNIYKNDITGAIPPLNTLLPGIYDSWKFIQQICSAPGCPSPEYQVICDCDDSCESCPDGTCPIQCGDRICCYGDDGIAVKSIPLADYCGD